MDNVKIKFIQVNKEAQPIKFDGFGFEMKFIDAVLARRRDGKDIVIPFTGYKIVIPEGYIGQVYDTRMAEHDSIQRLMVTNFVTNDFPYETAPDRLHIGFYLTYLVTGGITSYVFDKESAFFGINFFKKHSVQNMEVEMDIQEPPALKNEQQQRPQQQRQQQRPRNMDPLHYAKHNDERPLGDDDLQRVKQSRQNFKNSQR